MTTKDETIVVHKSLKPAVLDDSLDIDNFKETNLYEVYEAVCDHPGFTARELGEYNELYHSISVPRWLSELKAMGLVRNGDRRACGITCRNVLTWYEA